MPALRPIPRLLLENLLDNLFHNKVAFLVGMYGILLIFLLQGLILVNHLREIVGIGKLPLLGIFAQLVVKFANGVNGPFPVYLP